MSRSLSLHEFVVLAVLTISTSITTSTVKGASDVNYLVTKNIPYGDTSKPDREFQMLDVYWKDTTKKRPVIIYIHGGGWAFGDKSDVHLKPQFFAHHDISMVSMNYRLRWEYDLYDQVEDVAKVVRWVKDNHKNYGLDPTKIVLMGHAAGAHLAALVGTDQKIMKSQGLDTTDVRAIVTIDTASFDIPTLMAESSDFMELRRHRLIFGEDEKAWKAASPVAHIKKGRKIPAFALLYVAESESTATQARTFAKSLRDADAEVIMIPGNQKTAQTIDEELGTPGDAPTLALIAFINATI